jgi:hypothetical protein
MLGGNFFRIDLSLQKFECTAALHFMYDGMRFGSDRSFTKIGIFTVHFIWPECTKTHLRASTF